MLRWTKAIQGLMRSICKDDNDCGMPVEKRAPKRKNILDGPVEEPAAQKSMLRLFEESPHTGCAGGSRNATGVHGTEHFVLGVPGQSISENDVPGSVKRRLEFTQQEPNEPPVKKQRVHEGLTVHAIVDAAEEGGLQGKQFEIDLLKRLTGLPMTAARIQ